MDSYDEYIDSLMGQFQNNTITYVWEKPYMETPPSLTVNVNNDSPLINNISVKKQEAQRKAMREYILLATALGVVAYFVIKK